MSPGPAPFTCERCHEYSEGGERWCSTCRAAVRAEENRILFELLEEQRRTLNARLR